ADRGGSAGPSSRNRSPPQGPGPGRRADRLRGNKPSCAQTRSSFRPQHRRTARHRQNTGAGTQARLRRRGRRGGDIRAEMTNGAASYRIQRRLRNGAQEKTRTSTTVKPLAPEASAATNSATWARWVAPPRAGLIGGTLGAVNRLFSLS